MSSHGLVLAKGFVKWYGTEAGPNCGILNVRLRSLDVIYCKDILQEMGHEKCFIGRVTYGIQSLLVFCPTKDKMSKMGNVTETIREQREI